MGDLALSPWRRTQRCDGIALRGPNGESIHIRPRFRGALPEVLTSSERSTVMTDDGEIAYLFASGDRVVAAIPGEPSFLVEATGVSREATAALLRRCGLGQGASGKRAFEFTRPAGWHEERWPGESRYTLPGRTWTTALISVFDARPFSNSHAAKLDRFLHMSLDTEVEIECELEAETFETDGGLVGRIREVIARRAEIQITRFAVAFADARYLYAGSFEAPFANAAAKRTFDAVVRSFKPLPRPLSLTDTALSHWAD